jgi:hypothetical protein
MASEKEYREQKKNWPGLFIIVLIFLIAGYFLYTNFMDHKEETRTAKEMLAAAWQNFQLTEYNTSLNLFEKITDMTEKKDAIHLKALYGLGNVWWLRQEGYDKELAAEYFNQVIETAPESDMASWSRLALARMLHLVPVGSEVDYKKVRE